VIKRKFYDSKNHGFIIMSKCWSIDIDDLDKIKIAGLLLKKIIKN